MNAKLKAVTKQSSGMESSCINNFNWCIQQGIFMMKAIKIAIQWQVGFVTISKYFNSVRYTGNEAVFWDVPLSSLIDIDSHFSGGRKERRNWPGLCPERKMCASLAVRPKQALQVVEVLSESGGEVSMTSSHGVHPPCSCCYGVVKFSVASLIIVYTYLGLVESMLVSCSWIQWLRLMLCCEGDPHARCCAWTALCLRSCWRREDSWLRQFSP